MAYPWEDNPFAITPRAYAPPSEEDADSLLSTLGHGALSGLGYIGSILDKTFGGRAVRGILGGNFREALSPLPFSDTIGITNPDDIVTGKGLLQKAGILDEKDDSWGGTLGGIAAEIALDPANYLTFGAKALSQAGLNAAKGVAGAGKLAPTMAGRIAAGQGGLAGVRSPWFLSALGIGSHEPAAVLGTGAASESLARWLGGKADALKYSPAFKVPGLGEVTNPVPRLRQMFDPVGGGATANPMFQRALDEAAGAGPALRAEARGLLHPALTSEGEAFRAIERLQPGMAPAEIETLLGRARMQAAELPTRAPVPFVAQAAPAELSQLRALAPQFRPAFAPAFSVEADLVNPLRETLDATRDAYNTVGVNVADRGPNYLHRQLAARIKQAATPQARARLEAIADFPTSYIERQVADPAIGGFARDPLRGGLDPKLARAAIKTHKQQVINDIFNLPELSSVRDRLMATATAGPYGAFQAAEDANRIAKDFSRYVAKTDPAKFTKGGNPFFGHDTSRDVLGLIDKAARDVPLHQAAQSVIGQQSADFADLVRQTGDRAKVVSLDRLPDYLGGKNSNILTEAINRHNVLAPKDLKKFGVTRDVAEMLKAELDPARNVIPEAKGVLKQYDKYLQMFRRGVTVPFPGYTVRNSVDNAVRLARGHAGAEDALLGVKAAAGDFRGDPLLQQYAKEAWTHGAAFDRSTRGAEAVLSSTAPGEARFLQNPAANAGQGAAASAWDTIKGIVDTKSPGLKGKLKGTLNNYMDAMMASNTRSDDAARMAQFIAARKMGYGPAEAAKEVLDNFGRYSMTPFERSVMARAIPFYGFTRANLPTIARQLGTDPGVVASTIRGMNAGRQEAGFLPSWIGRGTAIPLPGAPEGQQRYLSQLGISLEDNAVDAIGSLLGGQFKQAAQQAGGLLAPQIKFPIEQMTDTQLFSGRKLSDLQPSGVFAGLPAEVGRPLTEIFANTPAARLISSVDRATDSRKSALERAINLLTGARITDVDLEKAQNVEGAKAIEELLKGSGKLRTYTRPYVPKEEIPNLSPDEQKLLAVLQLLEKRRKAAVPAANSRP